MNDLAPVIPLHGQLPLATSHTAALTLDATANIVALDGDHIERVWVATDTWTAEQKREALIAISDRLPALALDALATASKNNHPSNTTKETTQ